MACLLTYRSDGAPLPRAALPHLAAAAHEIWRARMIEEGWRPGERFNPRAKIHDALVPFHELRPDDREAAIEAAWCFESDNEMAELIDYPRGEERRQRRAEMNARLRLVPGLELPPGLGLG
jgi:hypothetical protein